VKRALGEIEWALVWVTLSCVIAGLLEWATVGLCAHQLTNVWELQWGSTWLLPSALLLGLTLAVAWTLWWQAWLVAGKFGQAAGEGALLLGVVIGGLGITNGRHFDVWWRRALFVALLVAAVGWGARRVRPLLQRALSTAKLRWIVGAWVVAIALELVNRWVLVRLYPAFHLGLWLLTAGALAFAGHLLSKRLARPHGRGALAARAAWSMLVVLSALGLQPAAERLSRFDNFRWTFLEHAPLLGRAVVAAAWIAPPTEPIDDEGTSVVNAAPESGPNASLEGRDVLLITIDALRADHVGAYGYARRTTPNIDALAAGGARFEYAYCATPHTSYSLTSLLTGKYIRPLLRQGVGEDSDTWASLLRTYGYRTAAFYPPAVFFIDSDRFTAFENSALGFEYQKKEFLEGEPRVRQVQEYLDARSPDQKLFVWVHLFGPHEPYEAHAGADFGDRDIDRYDSELFAADRTAGELVRNFREKRPGSVVILTADHGEEFGDHGGRYHGTSVYEEQVRVPLVLHVDGLELPEFARVVKQPVQTIDLLPTVLSALNVPLRPRIRGRDLSPLLFRAKAGTPAANGDSEETPSIAASAEDAGLAYSETDEHTLLARGSHRLICLRRLGACKLFDLAKDPQQLQDVSAQDPTRFAQLRSQLQAINADHGRFESVGLRAEGKHWPAPLIRGLAGDGDAAVDIGELLEDADVGIRRQAAEVLMRLRRSEAAPALRLAVQRDEDATVRRFAALTLTRLGEGAPLTLELVDDPDVKWRRLAALALAESGDARASDELVAWWADAANRDYQSSRDLLAAFAKIRSKNAVHGLIASLDDVRLRPEIAATLARIGESGARGPLALRLREEPYQTARVALAQALVQLGADTELVVPLRRWLAVPDPLKGGLGLALEAGITEHLGGASGDDLKRLRKHADIGESARIFIPKGGTGTRLRALVRVRNRGTLPATLRVGLPLRPASFDSAGKLRASQRVPELHPTQQLVFEAPPSPESSELSALVPEEFGWFPGLSTVVVVYAQPGLEFEGLAVLPLQRDLDVADGAEHPAGTPGKGGATQSEVRSHLPKR
jgi:arylsulfatase A-like enzyme/HEAT repeat protein